MGLITMLILLKGVDIFLIIHSPHSLQIISPIIHIKNTCPPPHEILIIDLFEQFNFHNERVLLIPSIFKPIYTYRFIHAHEYLNIKYSYLST